MSMDPMHCVVTDRLSLKSRIVRSKTVIIPASPVLTAEKSVIFSGWHDDGPAGVLVSDRDNIYVMTSNWHFCNKIYRLKP